MRAILLLGFLIFSMGSSMVFAGASADSKRQAKDLTAVTTKAFSESATKQIETTVRQYLLKKPEVVVEALQVYQQKQMKSMQQVFKETQQLAPKYADVIFHQAGDPVAGNVNGKITMVEFSDYQCSHCIEMSPVVDAIIKANPDLKVVFKEFPIRGGLSLDAACAVLAAKKQGKYFEFREALFKESAGLTKGKIDAIARKLGLNMSEFKKDMKDKTIRAAVEANRKLAMTLKLIGTPAFFIAKSDIQNGAPADAISYIPGGASQQQLQMLIDKTGK